jgi:putative DNA methylase
MPKQVEPIAESVQAKPHRPVYRMHRYFARRPYSVFAHLVSHYSEPGDLILDPFCGGGVTLVEGVLQGRRVAGFDTNPLATFVSRMELVPTDALKLRESQAALMQMFSDLNNRLFATPCRNCGSPARALWYEYSAIVTCSGCGRAFRISAAEKSGIGSWCCPGCGVSTRFSPRSDTPFELISVSYCCEACSSSEIVEPVEYDVKLELLVRDELAREEAGGLAIPAQR